MRLRDALLLAAIAIAVGACGGDDPPVCSLEGGTSLAATVWPKFRADLANTGRSTVDLSDAGGSLRLVSSYQTGGTVASSPAIGPQGEIYIGSTDGKLYRLALIPPLETFTVAWQGLTNGGIVTGPAIDLSGRIFTTANDGVLYTFASADGVQARGGVTVAGIPSAPTVAGPNNAGVIYVGTSISGMFAVCPNNIFRWQTVPTAAMPAVDEFGNIFVVGSIDSRSVLSIDPFNGVPNWVFVTSASIDASPVLGDDRTVFVVDRRGRTYALDPNTGSPVSGGASGVLYDAGAGVSASPALGVDGTLYVADLVGTVAAVDTDSGSARWRVAVADGTLVEPGFGSAINSSPAITMDGTLLFGADDGWLYGLSDLGDTVELRWSFQTGGAVRSSPAVGADGTIYFGSSDRNVYAVRPM